MNKNKKEDVVEEPVEEGAVENPTIATPDEFRGDTGIPSVDVPYRVEHPLTEPRPMTKEQLERFTKLQASDGAGEEYPGEWEELQKLQEVKTAN